MRKIGKWYRISSTQKAGRWLGKRDVRSYTPPAGCSAWAEMVEYHPATDKPLAGAEWWIFLTLDT